VNELRERLAIELSRQPLSSAAPTSNTGENGSSLSSFKSHLVGAKSAASGSSTSTLMTQVSVKIGGDESGVAKSSSIHELSAFVPIKRKMSKKQKNLAGGRRVFSVDCEVEHGHENHGQEKLDISGTSSTSSSEESQPHSNVDSCDDFVVDEKDIDEENMFAENDVEKSVVKCAGGANLMNANASVINSHESEAFVASQPLSFLSELHKPKSEKFSNVKSEFLKEMNLANEQDLQEIRQQLSEIKLTTKKKLQNGDNHNLACMNGLASKNESSVSILVKGKNSSALNKSNNDTVTSPEHNNSLNDLTQYSLNNELSFFNMLENNYAVGSPANNATSSHLNGQELQQFPLNDDSIENVFTSTSTLTTMQPLMPSYTVQQKPADQL